MRETGVKDPGAERQRTTTNYRVKSRTPMPVFSIGKVTKVGTNRSDRLAKVHAQYLEPTHAAVGLIFALDLVQEASFPLALALPFAAFEYNHQQCEEHCHLEQ